MFIPLVGNVDNMKSKIMRKFEYKVEVSHGGSLNENQLNQIGGEGWELVNVITIPPGMVTKLKVDYVFKRKCE